MERGQPGSGRDHPGARPGALDAGALVPPPSIFRATIGEFSPSHDQSMRVAEYNGLLRGLEGFGPAWDPWVSSTRGEVAQILHNLHSLD